MEGTTNVLYTLDVNDVQPVVDTIQANLDVLMPVGIAIMATMMGISLIPRIVYKFF